MRIIAQKIYGADDIELEPEAQKKVERYKKQVSKTLHFLTVLKINLEFCKISTSERLNNEKHQWKVLPNGVHLIGHTLGFHPQTEDVQLC